MRWYLQALNKYAVFEGRARRKEYWTFFLWNVAIVFVLAFVDAVANTTPGSGQGILVPIYQLAMLIPAMAVAVRRMHDTNHSGWWALVPFVSLVYAVTEGDRDANRYGPNPKELPQPAATAAVVGNASLTTANTQTP